MLVDCFKITKNWQLIKGKSGFLEEKAHFLGINATTHWKVGPFYNNYDVTTVEKRTAEPLVINSFVQKRAKNREKCTSGDY